MGALLLSQQKVGRGCCPEQAGAIRARRLEHHPCIEPHCAAAFVAFATPAQLVAHRRDAHSTGMPRFDRSRARVLELAPAASSLPRGPAFAAAAEPAAVGGPTTAGGTAAAGSFNAAGGAGVAAGTAAAGGTAGGRAGRGAPAPPQPQGGSGGGSADAAAQGPAAADSGAGAGSRATCSPGGRRPGSVGTRGGGSRGGGGDSGGGSGAGVAAERREPSGGRAAGRRGGLVMIDDDLGLQDAEVRCRRLPEQTEPALAWGKALPGLL